MRTSVLLLALALMPGFYLDAQAPDSGSRSMPVPPVSGESASVPSGRGQSAPGFRISLLVMDPSDRDFFSMFGHGALRVQDPATEMDLVYNFGYFPESGLTLFVQAILGTARAGLQVETFQERLLYEHFLGRGMKEVLLDLDPEEELRLIQRLTDQSSAARFAYNPATNNCSTRIYDLLADCLGKRLVFSPRTASPTWSGLARAYLEEQGFVGQVFFAFLGKDATRALNFREQSFLPACLSASLLSATVTRGKVSRPLVSRVGILVPGQAGSPGQPGSSSLDDSVWPVSVPGSSGISGLGATVVPGGTIRPAVMVMPVFFLLLLVWYLVYAPAWRQMRRVMDFLFAFITLGLGMAIAWFDLSQVHPAWAGNSSLAVFSPLVPCLLLLVGKNHGMPGWCSFLCVVQICIALTWLVLQGISGLVAGWLAGFLAVWQILALGPGVLMPTSRYRSCPRLPGQHWPC